MFPTADHIALSIVTACRLTGDGPMATCMRQPSRARSIAMHALMEVFPDARRESIARCCGLPKTNTIHATVGMARKSAWWREDWVDEVIGSLIDRFPDLSSHGETL
jgi:hypothetical protein